MELSPDWDWRGPTSFCECTTFHEHTEPPNSKEPTTPNLSGPIQKLANVLWTPVEAGNRAPGPRPSAARSADMKDLLQHYAAAIRRYILTAMHRSTLRDLPAS